MKVSCKKIHLEILGSDASMSCRQQTSTGKVLGHHEEGAGGSEVAEHQVHYQVKKVTHVSDRDLHTLHVKGI